MSYVDHKPVAVESVVVSTQHDPDVDNETIRKEVIDKVIKKSIPKESAKR